MIGLVFALPRELEAFRVKLGSASVFQADGLTFYYTCANGRSVISVSSGIGQERSRRAAESLLRIFNVDAIVSAGFAGGVKGDVRTGELIIARNVLNYPRQTGPGGASDAYSHPCHGSLVDLSCRLASENGLGFHCGDLLTVNEVVAQPDSKRRIGDTTSAVAIEMEGIGVAEAATASGAPFLALKVVSDETDDELKGDGLVYEDGRVNALGVIAHLLRNPLDLVYFLRLRHKTDTALEKLSVFLCLLTERYKEAFNPLHRVTEK